MGAVSAPRVLDRAGLLSDFACEASCLCLWCESDSFAVASVPREAFDVDEDAVGAELAQNGLREVGSVSLLASLVAFLLGFLCLFRFLHTSASALYASFT